LKSISPKYLFNGIQNYGSAYCEKETTNRFVYYHLICRRIFCIERIPKKQLVNNAQEKAEEHLIENYQGIEEVNIDREYYFFDPMGGLSVGGHINNKNRLTFNISFVLENNKIGRVESIVKAPGFPERKDGE